MENKFKLGDLVHAKANPALKLVIKRYMHMMYHCAVLGDLSQQEHCYFERELAATMSNGTRDS